MSGISVIICTYNGSALLESTIRHIVVQIHPLSPFRTEIIVVDNASTDDTPQLLAKEKIKYPEIDLKIFTENRKGKAYALDLGIKKSSHEVVLICDDDNFLMENYLEKVFEIMSSKPEVGILVGSGVPQSTIEFPIWFDAFNGGYAIGNQAKQTGFVEGKYYFYSAGMAIRKKAYLKIKQLGFENLLVGRQGKILSAGEDSEIACQVLLAGYKIWFDEKLQFVHFIKSQKLTLSYAIDLYKGFAKSDTYIHAYKYVLVAKKICSPFQWVVCIYHILITLRFLDLVSYFFTSRKKRTNPSLLYKIELIKCFVIMNFEFVNVVKKVFALYQELHNN